MRFADLKIKWKITLVAAAVFLPVMAAGTLYFYQQIYWLEVRNALGGLMNFVDAKQQGVIRFLDQNEKFAQQLAVLVQEADGTATRRYLRAVIETDGFDLKQHPFHEEIQAGKRRIPTWQVYHAIDVVRDGRIALSSDPAREGRAWTQNIDLTHGYSDVWRDGEVPVLSFGAPIAGGTVYVHADARMLTLIVNGEIGNLAGDMGAFYLAGVGKTFDYYIVNTDNIMLTESRVRPDALLKLRGSEFPWRVTQQDRSINIMCGKDGTYVTNAGCTTGCREAMGFYEGPTGKMMLGASMPFYDSRWTIVVEQEADELLQPLAELRNIMIVIGAISGLAAFLLFVWVVNRYIVGPLGHLTSTIQAMAAESGEFDLTSRYESDRRDEIGEISRVFDTLIGSLHKIVEHIRNDAERLGATVSQLSSSSDEMAHSSRQQMDSAATVASSVEQLTTSIGQVAELASETRRLAAADLERAAEGAQVTQGAAREMERIAESVANSSRLVDTLNERSSQIGGIVQVIRGIAEQTNLLALNAAIEAARAGENGRGFAVVADEVRALAARTQQATSEISGLIDAIHNEVEATVAGMEQTRGQAEQGVSMVTQVQQALSGIGASAQQTAGKVHEIADATHAQSAASDEVAANVEAIARMAEANNATAEQTAAAAAQLQELAQQLQQAVAHFRT
ncbi:methyl-accepting chemotaxis protein [Sulfurivermis fontis]|uniref:methyl-accepting chemotaxis protein n=1 Tax=Sulfurivermis fontis TaxID=1972068 RepID=UPI000FD9169A|nr:methyl-accepting chemotaxis protein [Sulfurivermis fontis]